MAQKRFEVLTPWVEEENEDGDISRWPLVTSEYHMARWQDITGQDAANIAPEPNLVSILAEADETVLDAIESDNRFLLLWEESL